MFLTTARRKQFAVITGMFIATLLILVATVHAAGHNLTQPGASATINGATFEVFTPDEPAGSEPFNAFVRIGHKTERIKGYNTDYRPVQFDERKGTDYTRSLLLSEIPQVDISSTIYRVFHLDINQKARGRGTSTPYYLTLDEVEIYEGPYAQLCGYPFDGSGGGQTGCNTNNTATFLYSMDEGVNSFLVLDYRNNAGSGKRDLRLLVPDFYFNQSPDCDYGGIGCTVYVTLYSEFGADYDAANSDSVLRSPHGNTAGFEEWGLP